MRRTGTPIVVSGLGQIQVVLNQRALGGGSENGDDTRWVEREKPFDEAKAGVVAKREEGIGALGGFYQTSLAMRPLTRRTAPRINVMFKEGQGLYLPLRPPKSRYPQLSTIKSTFCSLALICSQTLSTLARSETSDEMKW